MDMETGDSSNKGGRRREGLRKLSGILLSVIGILWLAKKAGWMPIEHNHAAVFWPMVVIAAGLFMLFGSAHKRKRHEI
jgi:hypothetical protein